MTNLHGVDGDGECRVIPVHLVFFSVLLVPHGALMCGADAEHTQNDHEHQEADTHHDNNGGGAGDDCEERRVVHSHAFGMFLKSSPDDSACA